MFQNVIPFKEILKSRTNWLHLILFLIIITAIATILYILVIPLTFWIIYGEGATADRIADLPISIFIDEWIPLITVLLITGCNMYLNTRKKDLRQAKSHLLIAIIITILYLFKNPILDLAFEIFQ